MPVARSCRTPRSRESATVEGAPVVWEPNRVPIRDQIRAAAALARTVGVPFERPDRLARALLTAAPWGIGLSGLVAAAAGRYPEAAAIVDDEGAISYGEVW